MTVIRTKSVLRLRVTLESELTPERLVRYYVYVVAPGPTDELLLDEEFVSREGAEGYYRGLLDGMATGIPRRPETGPMQFGDDWPGLFLRGDDAFGFAVQLERVLVDARTRDPLGGPLSPASQCGHLVQLLRRPIVKHGRRPEEIQLLQHVPSRPGALEALLARVEPHVDELLEWTQNDDPGLGAYLDELVRLLDILRAARGEPAKPDPTPPTPSPAPVRMFPILWQHGREVERKLSEIGVPRAVPWAFAETARRRAERNHGQTLERLAERGGLSPEELVCALDDRDLFGSFNAIELGRALVAKLEAWESASAARRPYTAPGVEPPTLSERCAVARNALQSVHEFLHEPTKTNGNMDTPALAAAIRGLDEALIALGDDPAGSHEP